MRVRLAVCAPLTRPSTAEKLKDCNAYRVTIFAYLSAIRLYSCLSNLSVISTNAQLLSEFYNALSESYDAQTCFGVIPGLYCKNFLRTKQPLQSALVIQQLQKFERAYST